MIRSKKAIAALRPIVLFVFPALFGLVLISGAGASSLIYKNYVIRYDRGWDILCEPYQVHEGDWVLKIFRQKGEIAHQDFREFLSIFQRLNPHIRDIDLIRPGQAIDIPLRKLEHGSLPGQSSGVVTIPFVALNKVEDVLARHVDTYKVQWGDTVSKLISARYGRFGTPSYNEGVKLFKAANPDITDLDRILAGQSLYLPNPASREETLQAAAKEPDESNVAGESTLTSVPPAVADQAVSLPVPTVPPPTSPLAQGALQEAAAVVGGNFIDKGTRFVPRQDGTDVEVDLSRFPMLQLENEPDLVFTPSNTVMGVDKSEVEAQWRNTKVVSYDPDATVEQIVQTIFETLQNKPVADSAPADETGFDDRGIRVDVRAKWIRPASDGRKICIVPIESPSNGTSEAMRRYLEQHDIVLKELLPGGKTYRAPISDEGRRHAVPNILDLTPGSQKDFVHHLAKALGFNYMPNVPITFPYAGEMVKAYSNLLSTGDRSEILVDFGDLYGDTLTAIRESGPVVVQIEAGESYDRIARKLLSALKLMVNENPGFLAAARPARYNTVITVSGMLLNGLQGREILLTSVPMNPAVTDLVTAKGVAIVQW